jgi:hypothetical protein
MKAFPHDPLNQSTNGMDLRDYFAAKAMQAYISRSINSWNDDLTEIAKRSYIVADALLNQKNA